MDIIYLLLIWILVVIVFGFLFYRLAKKLLTTYYWNTAWENTINLEIIVREIITKALIISISENKNSKLENEEKTKAIIEKASAISADVLLQHNIEPKNYNLPALVEIEIFRLNKSITKVE